MEIFYKCGICGASFNNKEDCEICEQNHNSQLKVLKSFYKDFETTPEFIYVYHRPYTVNVYRRTNLNAGDITWNSFGTN